MRHNEHVACPSEIGTSRIGLETIQIPRSVVWPSFLGVELLTQRDESASPIGTGASAED
jgi:hypothetical protein